MTQLKDNLMAEQYPDPLSNEEAIALNHASADNHNRALAVRGLKFKIEKRGPQGWYSFEDILHAIAALVEDLADDVSNRKN